MAGLGARLFPAFSKLTSAQVNGYLMDQSIMRFANATARDAAFVGVGNPTKTEGMTCYLDDLNVLQTYTGSAWVEIASTDSKAPRGIMGYAEKITNTGPFFTETVFATLPSFTAVAGRYYKATGFFPLQETSGAGNQGNFQVRIRKGTTTAGTELQKSNEQTIGNADDMSMSIVWVGTLTAGAQQMVLTFQSSANTIVYGSATNPIQFFIEDIGAV